MKVLNFINERIGRLISTKLLDFLDKKAICSTFEGFKEFTCKRVAKHAFSDDGVVLEGHFHQNQSFTCKDVLYVNFSSFACERSYFVVQFDKSMKFAELKLRGSNVGR